MDKTSACNCLLALPCFLRCFVFVFSPKLGNNYTEIFRKNHRPIWWSVRAKWKSRKAPIWYRPYNSSLPRQFSSTAMNGYNLRSIIFPVRLIFTDDNIVYSFNNFCFFTCSKVLKHFSASHHKWRTGMQLATNSLSSSRVILLLNSLNYQKAIAIYGTQVYWLVS